MPPSRGLPASMLVLRFRTSCLLEYFGVFLRFRVQLKSFPPALTEAVLPVPPHVAQVLSVL